MTKHYREVPSEVHSFLPSQVPRAESKKGVRWLQRKGNFLAALALVMAHTPSEALSLQLQSIVPLLVQVRNRRCDAPDLLQVSRVGFLSLSAVAAVQNASC